MSQSDQMQDVVPTNSEVTKPDDLQEPEVISETLYIQNLNEKIKIPGTICIRKPPLFEHDALTPSAPQY
jgi:hypothetical protein